MDYLLEDGFVGRARNACVSQDDVKLTKVLGEFSEELLAVLRNRNVSAIAMRFRSQLSDRFIHCLLIATRNCDFRAFRDEKAGSAQADAAVASSNESLFCPRASWFLLDGRLIAILAFRSLGCRSSAFLNRRDVVYRADPQWAVLRRLQPAAVRKQRSLPYGAAHGSNRSQASSRHQIALSPISA